jgi:hypothetical protein
MRGLLAFLAGVVAVVALAVGLPAAWTAQHVADEDGFVELARDVTGTAAVRSSAAELVADRLEQRAGLPPQLAEAGRRLIEREADRVLADRAVTRAWQETLRRTHAALLADPPPGTGAVPVPLDVAPLAALVAGRTDGLVQAPDQLVVELEPGPSARTLRAVDASPRVATLALATAAVAGVLALLVARRRAVAMLWLGLGTMLAAAVDAGLLRLARDRAVVDTGADVAQGALVRALVDVGVASFDRWLVWAALAGAVAAVLGIVGALVARRG